MAPEKNDENGDEQEQEREQEASSGQHGESHEPEVGAAGGEAENHHEAEKRGEAAPHEEEPHGTERDLEGGQQQQRNHDHQQGGRGSSRRSRTRSSRGRTFHFVIPIRPLSAHVPNYQLSRLACYFPIYGTIFAIAGTLAIVLPLELGVALPLLFSWTLAGLGVVSLLLFFLICGAPGTIGALLLAALHLSSGVYLLWYPVEGETALTFVVCCWFLAHGLLKAVFTIGLRKLTVWPLLLISAIGSFILCFVILAMTPTRGTTFMGIAFGADLVGTGVAVLLVSVMACFASGERAITDAEAVREPLLHGGN